MRTFLALALFSIRAFAQSITIPAQTVVTPITIQGKTQNISVTIPAQTVQLPAQTGGLPAGFTWANGVFTVPGIVSATQLSLTGGPALPTCASNLYLWKNVSGVLQPSCYTPPPIPGTIVFTPSAGNAINLSLAP